MSRLSSIFRRRNQNFNYHVNAYASTNAYGGSSSYQPSQTTRANRFMKFPGMFGRFKLSKQLLALLIIVVVAVAGFGLWFKNAAGKVTSASPTSGDQEEVAAPYATKPIDREFSFPLRNEKGEKVSEFKYVVQNAELTNEIVVKGQKASSVKGRTFFVINLKINNDGKQKVQVNSRDYIRLVVNNNSAEMLAPDIHNDPVEVQPISTKFTRLGFAINDTDKNLKVQVGEIDGEKQYIDLQFD